MSTDRKQQQQQQQQPISMVQFKSSAHKTP